MIDFHYKYFICLHNDDAFEFTVDLRLTYFHFVCFFMDFS